MNIQRKDRSTMKHVRTVMLGALLLAGLASHAEEPKGLAAAPETPPVASAAVSAAEPADAALLDEGARLYQAHKFQQAIDESFDKVIASYETKYGHSDERVFCADNPTIALLYLVMGANAKQQTRVLSPTWTNALYLKAGALIELGQLSQAKAALERAVSLAPKDSHFIAELAYIYQREKNWPTTEKLFLEAESSAREFARPENKDKFLARAWRGLGYVYVEENRLDEAEKMYRQSIEIDKTDKMAAGEIAYIQDLRAKQAGPQQ